MQHHGLFAFLSVMLKHQNIQTSFQTRTRGIDAWNKLIEVRREEDGEGEKKVKRSAKEDTSIAHGQRQQCAEGQSRGWGLGVEE